MRCGPAPSGLDVLEFQHAFMVKFEVTKLTITVCWSSGTFGPGGSGPWRTDRLRSTSECQ